MMVIIYDDKDHVDGRNEQPHWGFNFPNASLSDFYRRALLDLMQAAVVQALDEGCLHRKKTGTYMGGGANVGGKEINAGT